MTRSGELISGIDRGPIARFGVWPHYIFMRNANTTLSPKQQMLEADRRLMSALIRRAVGRCECCGREKEYKFRACLVCSPPAAPQR